MAKIDEVRYARQIMMPELGKEGQARLARSSALVVGAGGLGAPLLQYLVASGVGRIGIVDSDSVELSNLNRQVLYTEADLGRQKATAATARLALQNSACDLRAYALRLDRENAVGIASGYDLLIDASDNLATRYLLDATAQALGIPYLYGAVEGFVGQSSLFHYAGAGAYRDLFPDYAPEADARPVGVIGATAGVLGSLMATEAIKVLLGMPSSLAGKLLRFDLSRMDFHTLTLPNIP